MAQGETYISIHAPLRGRLMDVKHKAVLRIFQSTPPCGGDGPAATIRNTNTHFNPRPLAGATRTKVVMIWPRAYFNPRPLAGATRTGSRGNPGR